MSLYQVSSIPSQLFSAFCRVCPYSFQMFPAGFPYHGKIRASLGYQSAAWQGLDTLRLASDLSAQSSSLDSQCSEVSPCRCFFQTVSRNPQTVRRRETSAAAACSKKVVQAQSSIVIITSHDERLCIYNKMNKMASQRYPSHGQLSRLSRSPRSSDSQGLKKINHSVAVTLLSQKESHIEMLKRRISALCVKEEKINHKTMNNEIRWEQKYKIKEDSRQIKMLLQKERKKDEQRIQALKSRNLQSRVENYYRSKTFKRNQLETKRELTNLERTKSRQYERMIIKQKEEAMEVNKQKKQEVCKAEQTGKTERSRIKLERQMSLQQTQKRQVEHLLNLGSIKDNQLSKLGELQLLMVEKHTSSKMAYDASIERLGRLELKRKSSSHYYRPRELINSARRENTSRVHKV